MHSKLGIGGPRRRQCWENRVPVDLPELSCCESSEPGTSIPETWLNPRITAKQLDYRELLESSGARFATNLRFSAFRDTAEQVKFTRQKVRKTGAVDSGADQYSREVLRKGETQTGNQE